MDLGPEKLLFLLVVAFIILGPKELPSLARRAGEMMRTVRSLQASVRSELTGALRSLDSPDPGSGKATDGGNGSGPSSFT